MYKKIIVAVDVTDLEKAERIIPRAVNLLEAGGRIVLLSVVEDLPGYVLADVPPSIMADARKETETRLLDLRHEYSLSADIEVRHGAPARAILACAEAQEADLIILASHRPDFSNYFLGATADRVVRHAQCSVLVDR